MHFARPYFVTPHAVNRYRERLDVKATPAQAIERIQAALQEPVFERPGRDGSRIVGCRLTHDGRNTRFCAVVIQEPGREWSAVASVGEWWRWHEHRDLWGDAPKPPASVQAALRRGRTPQAPARHGKRWTYDEEDFACQRLHIWTPEAIARRLGRTPAAVARWLYTWRQGPTRQTWLTSGQAAKLAGCTQQWLTRLAKAGRARARRVPGGRWWLFDPAWIREHKEELCRS